MTQSERERTPEAKVWPDDPEDEAAGDGAGVFEFVADADGVRLDKYLAEAGPWSRAFVQQLIAAGRVAVGGRTARASKKIVRGERLRVDVPEPEPLAVEPEDIPLEIAYEDEELLVVNKPRGMVVHPALGHARGTLVSALLWHAQELSARGGAFRPGIVHRIDKDTSGLLLVAKTDFAHAHLSAQLKEHSVTRLYEAIVHGVIPHESGAIDAPIGRHPQKRQQMAVREDGSGREAVTHFRVLERFAAYTYLELRLETGRTHQIRVHMAYISHPVVGDPVYATRDPFHLNGQALHAKTLGFTHPRSGERMLFHAPPPQVFMDVLEDLRRRKQ